MAYKKEHQCERCGKTTISRTAQKKFCGDCKIINSRTWKKEWLKNPVNLEKHREGLKIAKKKYPETYRKKQARYIKRHPEIVKAHSLSQNIPKEKECGICKSNERLERHHWDYSKPKVFSTLCKPCHTSQHCKTLLGVN